jgi:hypothetical protein
MRRDQIPQLSLDRLNVSRTFFEIHGLWCSGTRPANAQLSIERIEIHAGAAERAARDEI